MKLPNTFITYTPDVEPLNDKPCNQSVMDEYIVNDAERANQPITQASCVYDSVDVSPHYDGTANDLYIDEKDLIELPAPYN